MKPSLLALLLPLLIGQPACGSGTPGAGPGGGPAGGDPGKGGLPISSGANSRPRPALGQGSGGVFMDDTVFATDFGGLEKVSSGWDALTLEAAKKLKFADRDLPLAAGLVWVVRTRMPDGANRAGWTKFEVTKKTGKKWELRYLHWPEDGSAPLPGTAHWTPDDTAPTLWYSGADDPSLTVEAGGGPTTPPADAPTPAPPVPVEGGAPAPD